MRGFITGSAWSEYRRTAQSQASQCPKDCKMADMFPEPLFTPSTKAEEGHDENITVAQMEDLVGNELTDLPRASVY